jgi:hypothetical protein
MVEAGESKGFAALCSRKVLILRSHQKLQIPLNPRCGHVLGTWLYVRRNGRAGLEFYNIGHPFAFHMDASG